MLIVHVMHAQAHVMCVLPKCFIDHCMGLHTIYQPLCGMFGCACLIDRATHCLAAAGEGPHTASPLAAGHSAPLDCRPHGGAVIAITHLLNMTDPAA